MNPENAEQQPPKEGEEPKVEFEVPDIKVDMKEQQIAFIKNLFENPEAGIEWVNKTFDSLKDETGTIPRATFGPKIKKIAMDLGAPEPRPEDLEAAVAAADPDGDGQITYDEFKNFCVNSGDGLLILLGVKKVSDLNKFFLLGRGFLIE